MDLFEKVKEISKLIEKANKAKEELTTLLTKQFIELPYRMQKIEAGYPEYPYGNRIIIEVYYPVLDVPTGFVKENETFYREYANCVMHEYTLKDEEGREVLIQEHGTFAKSMYKSDKGTIELKNYIILPEIKYGISISESKYNFGRKIIYEDMLEQILGTDKRARIKGSYYSEIYQNAEAAYEKFLKELGATNKLPTLEELYESKQNEIQITQEIKAKLEMCSNRRTDSICLENLKFSVRLNNLNTLHVLVEIQPYLNEAIKLEKRRYEYFKLKNEEKLQEGITLEEAIKIIEEK